MFERICARAPLRIGLAGGGTDLSPYCDQFGGAVLNCTIDRYAHAVIIPRKDRRIVFEAHDLNSVSDFDLTEDLLSTKLVLHRGIYERMVRDYNKDQRVPLNIITYIDAPMGSGLGASSALAVALIEAFCQLFGARLGAQDVARLAFDIERVDLKLAGGRQDQYAAALGGFNFIEFLANERAHVHTLTLSRQVQNELEASMMICFSGKSRDSAGIIMRQTAALNSDPEKTVAKMHQLKDDAIQMKELLFRGKIGEMATLLSRSWEIKKATANGISSPEIDAIFNFTIKEGALGGKVSGAGGGGFMFFIVPPERRYKIIQALRKKGILAEPIAFSSSGVEAWKPFF